MEVRPHERRSFARVRIQAPVYFRALTRSELLREGAEIEGELVDAGRGGVAFRTHIAGLRIGDVIDLAVETFDGERVLNATFARVVNVEAENAAEIVSCSFVVPTPDHSWIVALTGARVPGSLLA
jgi:hypothetical protein